MKWRRLLVTVSVLVASLSLATVAVSADEVEAASGTEPEAGTPTLPLPAPTPGLGTLKARGDGFAGVHGDGWMRLKGHGILWVRNAEGIEIEGTGRRIEFEDGWVEYIGFNGVARIRGRNVSVMVAGHQLDLHCIGHGKAALWGKGQMQVNGLPAVPWPGLLHPVSY